MRNVLRIINPYEPGIFPEGEVINLSSNENPYEPSEAVKNAYMHSLSRINRYPDASYSKLKKAISDYTGVETERIAVGCGSSELISCICEALVEELDKVVIPMPSYSLYAIYAMLRNSSILMPVFENYELEANLFEEERPKLTILCSPNNPTGNVVEKKVVEKIAESSEFLVIDEAYAEFSEENLLAFALQFDNVIVLRSFSKFFGLAGLRIGYAIASKEIANAIEKIRLPFAISSPAVEVAISAIKSLDYYLELKKKIISERERVFMELKKLGLVVYPSKANFLLVKTTDDLFELLLSKGIVVRNLINLIGLEGKYLRITIGRREENDALLNVLKLYCRHASA
ncbi:MAG: histidinol-phosphate transaminase [Archaeoglobaceae archaeon]